MTDDLARIEQLVGAMLRTMAPGQRVGLLRHVARDLAGGQRARIARQQAPDGSRFAPRRAKPEPTPGAYPVRFLYPKGAAEPRLVRMKSWRKEGPLLTGFDLEAGAIRSFFWDQVAKWLPVSAEDGRGPSGKLRRRGRIRQRAMFRRLGRGRHLKSGATPDQAWAGFAGRASAIARIHQEGRMDKPAAKARPVRYQRRVLIGDTAADRARILDLVLQRLTPAG